MRCIACDKIMTDYELTKKFSGSGEFVDMCNECSRFLIEDDLTAVGNVDYELSDRQKLDLAYYEYCVFRHRGRRPEPYESTLRGYQEIERSSLDPLI